MRMISDFCILPNDDGKARELLLSRTQYYLVDGILYYVAIDRTLCPPTNDREQHFKEAHSGPFGAFLREGKAW